MHSIPVTLSCERPIRIEWKRWNARPSPVRLACIPGSRSDDKTWTYEHGEYYALACHLEYGSIMCWPILKEDVCAEVISLHGRWSSNQTMLLQRYCREQGGEQVTRIWRVYVQGDLCHCPLLELFLPTFDLPCLFSLMACLPCWLGWQILQVCVMISANASAATGILSAVVEEERLNFAQW